MTRPELKQELLAATASGYAVIAFRVSVGLITFRLLYQGLSAEEFGFWVLLWAVMGFGIVVDFGFGYSVRKRVAEHSVRKEWQALSEVLSTVISAYIVSALVIFAVGALSSSWLVETFRVPPSNRTEYRSIFLLFLSGAALLFPLGIFSEVLNGQQRLVLLNGLTIAGSLLNLAAVATVITLDLGLGTLVIATMACSVVGSLAAAYLGMKYMPQVHIHPRHLSLRTLKDTTKFSIFIYLNTLSTVVYTKTAQPLISSTFGLTALPPYQAGAKVGEMTEMMILQLGKVLSPKAAHLHAKGDTETLRGVLLGGMRLNALLGALLCIPMIAYMKGILRITTGEANPTLAMIVAGTTYVSWLYTRSITHTVYKEIYGMAGRERQLMVQGIAETVFGLSAGIGTMLALRSHLPPTVAASGMIFGQLLASLVIGWFVLWRWTAQAAELSQTKVFCQVVLPTWVGALPMLASILIFRNQPLWESSSNTFLTLLEGTISGLIGIAGMWRWALKPGERDWVRGMLASRLKR